MKLPQIVTLVLVSLVPVALLAQRASILPDAAGVFHQDARGVWTTVPTNPLKLEMRGGVKWILSVGDEYERITLDGAHAGLQVNDSRPTFYVARLTPYPQAQIVRLDAHRDERRISTRGIDGAGGRLRFHSRDIIEADIVPSGDVFSVRPRAALAPGEYMIVTSVLPGARRVLLGSEFGVTK